MNATRLEWPFFADPWATYQQLAADGPVSRVDLPDGVSGWLVTGYDEARLLLDDRRLSTDQTRQIRAYGDNPPPGALSPLAANMLTSDPPDHTRLRRLINRAFTPRRVAELRASVQAIADGLLDTMGEEGQVDLVDAYAFPLPIAVISELLGVPYHDRDQVRLWSHAFVTDSDLDDESKARAGQDWFAYLVALIEEKRSAPGPDLLSALIEASQDSDRLDPQELISMVFLLMLAGHETTVSLIGNAVYALLRHPEQLEQLRADPALLPGAVEEVLRYESPVHIPSRRVTLEPVTIGGVEIPAGQFVHISLPAANRDGNKFPDPAHFDITRDARGHLAFGHGIHFCVGAPLARMEGEIALRKLLDRYPRLELGAQDPTFSRRTSMLVYSLKSLPVSFSTATPSKLG